MIELIHFRTGNLLEDDAEALVNTVNCVGVMGKGIALQFKQAYPDVYKEYAKECKQGNMEIGKVHVVSTDSLFGTKYIINFPTKKHWKEKSKMHYVEDGLQDLVKVINDLGIQSVAIPPLGCGNGGLEWMKVKAKIIDAFQNSPIDIHVYEPAGSPKPDEMKIRTKKPNMTKSRALLLASMNDYSVPGYRLSLLEIQKIAYFLQEVGEPLKLRFEKNKYGPYAENLNHVLLRMDGHFIRGFGDRNREAEIYLLADAAEKAKNYLRNDEESEERLSKVQQIIRGFETPYGMELLATVHWIIRENHGSVLTLDFIINEVHNWNERKRKVFNSKHIEKAWKHFQKLEFI
ncbi:macro domain-containing protein [Bacillaceae bacterium S4-13-58]